MAQPRGSCDPEQQPVFSVYQPESNLEGSPETPITHPSSRVGSRGPEGGLRGCPEALIGVSSVPKYLSVYYQDPSQGRISVWHLLQRYPVSKEGAEQRAMTLKMCIAQE